MGKLKKYLLIAVALAALFILSAINQDGRKSGPCCPFSIKHNGESK